MSRLYIAEGTRLRPPQNISKNDRIEKKVGFGVLLL
jgi:hypothetical protein